MDKMPPAYSETAAARTPRLTARLIAQLDERRQFWLWTAAFVVSGFLLRALLATLWQTLHRPDEVFQSLEPAWRLWRGQGVISWEWRDGIRSWLFPDFIYLILRTSSLLHLPSKLALPLIWTVFSAIASATIAIGAALGWRQSRLTGAILCGLLCAFWPDLIYFGPKTLTEVQAGNLLVIAAGLASLDEAKREHRPSWLAAIGALLGLTFALRFQLSPALGLIAIWAARLDLRRGWLPLILGAAIPLVALGVVDWVTWGSPFQSIWKNVLINLLQNKAQFYGVEPPSWYFTEIIVRYGAAFLPLAIFFALGATRAPLLALVTIVVVLFHTAIGHKEISFIYAGLPTAIVTVGLGTAHLADRLPRLLREPVGRTAVLTRMAFLWLMTLILTGAALHPFRQEGDRAALTSLWGDLRAAHDLCGIGLYGDHFPWAYTTGFSGLDRNVPMYLPENPAELQQSRAGFNYVIAKDTDLPDLGGYQQLRCSWNFCVLRRPAAQDQSCPPVAQGLTINTHMEQRGE